MDKCVYGHMRYGYARYGVVRDDWDQLLQRFKNVSAKTAGGITPAIQGVAQQGRTRQRVYIPFFDEMLEQFEKV